MRTHRTPHSAFRFFPSPALRRSGFQPFLLAAFSLSLSAANLTWNGSDGSWLDSTAWTPSGTVPTSADDPSIGSGHVTLADGSTGSFGTLRIGTAAGASGTVTINGLLSSSANTHVGNDSIGILSIGASGTLANATGLIGVNAGGSGTASVAGLWQNTSNLYVGNNGTGYLEILPSGTVVNRVSFIAQGVGSTGTAVVGGYWQSTSGSFIVGGNGNGYLNILSGATVSNRVGYVGYTDTGCGTIIVSGAWQNTTLVIGNNGAGTLDIHSTGTVICGTTYIGRYATATGTAFVSGLWSVDGVFEVGRSGVGYLHILHGGTVEATGIMRIGSGVGGSGTAIVEGLWYGHSNFTVAATSGTAYLDILPTGTIRNNHGFVALLPNSHATVIVSGVWANSGSLVVGGTGIGYVDIRQTGTVSNKIATVGASSVANGTVVVAGVWQSNGNLNLGPGGPGHLSIMSTGTVIGRANYISGPYASLDIEVQSGREAPYLVIGGAATLGGPLTLTGSAAADIAYTGDGSGRASHLRGIPLLTADGGIVGDFSSITITGGASQADLPDFIRLAGIKVAESGGLASRYDVGYGLAWNSSEELSHGIFTVAEGKTFDVDVQLSDRSSALVFSSGWDGKSLTKKGDGTLVLSVENSYSGTTTIQSGTIRFEGQPNIKIGALVNNSVVDFGGQTKVLSPDPGSSPSLVYRTLRATSLTGSGTFRMKMDIAAGLSDRLVIDGDASGAHRLLITGFGDMPAGNEPMLTLVTLNGVDETQFTSGGELPGGTTFEGSFDYGNFNYAVEQVGHRIVVRNTGLDPAVCEPIHGVPGAQSILWFDQHDNLSRRIGELRGLRETGPGVDIWMRGTLARLAIGGGSTDMRQSDVNLWTAEIGLDYSWQFTSDRIVAGVFANSGNTSQKFQDIALTTDTGRATATGASRLVGVGLYAAWLSNAGWFVHSSISADYYKNTFEAVDGSLNLTTGDYIDRGFGAAVEAGRRFDLAAGWFVEPSLQGAITRINRGDYTTAGTGAANLSVICSEATISRLRGAVRFGKAWQGDTVGWLEVVGRAGATHERSTGGEVIITEKNRWRPNLDGDRYEGGVSLFWRPKGRSGQIYFDYEHVIGSNYHKPWAISLGFRMFFR